MSKKYLIILATVLLLIVIGFGAWQYYANIYPKANQQNYLKSEENQYYSILIPSDWKMEKDDIGSAFDKRLFGYTYGPYVNLDCATITLTECDPAASSTVNLSVFVYKNRDELSVNDYVKTIYKSFPNAVKLSDGFISSTFENIPKTKVHSAGVKVTNYFIDGDKSYRYYFSNSNYVYLLNVSYLFSKTDTKKGIKKSYQKLSEKYQPIIDNEIDSFLLKEKQ